MTTETEPLPTETGRPPRPNIQGWGADLDRANRPAVPMERTPPRLEGVHPGPLEQQPRRMEIFVSTERPEITPVFGTSVPPSGLSGRIRQWAFKLSENDIRHWLLLLFADRVNMVEGIGSDLRRGHVPNVFAEMGGKAAWKHDPVGVVRTVAIGAAVTALVVYGLRRRSRRR